MRSTSGIICGSGSFAVQFGDHFRSGDHLRSGIICGTVNPSDIPYCKLRIPKRELLGLKIDGKNSLYNLSLGPRIRSVRGIYYATKR